MSQGIHWMVKYQLERSWVGPDDPQGRPRYNCWDFTKEVQLRDFGREVKLVVPDNYNVFYLSKLLRDNPELASWEQTATPREGDVVMMGHSRREHHVGVWTTADEGKIVHCSRGVGVTARSEESMRAEGWANFSYWTHRGAQR